MKEEVTERTLIIKAIMADAKTTMIDDSSFFQLEALLYMTEANLVIEEGTAYW